jgi:hypothetical protein
MDLLLTLIYMKSKLLKTLTFWNKIYLSIRGNSNPDDEAIVYGKPNQVKKGVYVVPAANSVTEANPSNTIISIREKGILENNRLTLV